MFATGSFLSALTSQDVHTGCLLTVWVLVPCCADKGSLTIVDLAGAVFTHRRRWRCADMTHGVRLHQQGLSC
jgi:hypothetical protein